jgi:hypothetical protein
MGKMKVLKRSFKLFLVVFSVFSVVALAVFAIQLRRYNQWYKETFDFQISEGVVSDVSPSTSNSSSFICLSGLYIESSEEKVQEGIEKKIRTFILSDSRTDFVVLTVGETLHLLSTNIQMVERIDIEDICLDSSRGLWQVYIKYKMGRFSLPWIVMDVVKDNRETAEIYVNVIKIGDIEIPEFIAKGMIVDINRGIADAVIMLNENRFLGRIIQNVELLDDRVVFKGSI